VNENRKVYISWSVKQGMRQTAFSTLKDVVPSLPAATGLEVPAVAAALVYRAEIDAAIPHSPTP